MDLSAPTTASCEEGTRPSKTFTTSPAPTPIPPTHTPVATAKYLRTLSSPVQNKMYSKNANGTVILTTNPSNDAELQLYRVMQRASLLAYYDTLLEMGGDDIQQLCDAGEEEFLEIMALVGMASKPLHVRRFQKSLQEWMIDPGTFQVPLASNSEGSSGMQNIPSMSSDLLLNLSNVVCCTRRSILDTNRPVYSSPLTGNGNLSGNNGNSTPSETATSAISCSSPVFSASNKSSSSRSSSPLDSLCNSSGANGTILSETHIERLKTSAEKLSKQLPQFEPKPHNAKRKVCKELEVVMSMVASDPHCMDAIRRYAAIYGRFDCKRRPEKPLTLHEASVNEAAAQLCYFVPALLTRRDELFPLARQVVRDSGTTYMYSAGIPISINGNGNANTNGNLAGNGKSTSQVKCWNIKKSSEDDIENEDESPPKKQATADKVTTA